MIDPTVRRTLLALAQTLLSEVDNGYCNPLHKTPNGCGAYLAKDDHREWCERRATSLALTALLSALEEQERTVERLTKERDALKQEAQKRYEWVNGLRANLGKALARADAAEARADALAQQLEGIKAETDRWKAYAADLERQNGSTLTFD